jgi:predicted nucleotidyltransferase component of viral defense system
MKEEILKRAKKGRGSFEKLNLLREELHHLILQEIDRKGGFEKICFQDGTALRIIFGLDRFFEDLDFCVSSQLHGSFHLEKLVKSVQNSLQAFGFDCELSRQRTTGAVHSCFFRFAGLVEFLASSFRKTQKLGIKIEVDTNPPAGGHETVSPVTGIHLYKVRHHDLPSLFAGKLHAILCRKYTKGRDLYDFLWYSARRTPVNLTMLENAVFQTSKNKVRYTQESLRKALKLCFEKIDWSAAKKDVEPFVSDSNSLSLFKRDIFLETLQHIQFEKNLRN